MVTINKKYLNIVVIIIFILTVFFYIRSEKNTSPTIKDDLGPQVFESNQINKINYVKIAGKNIKVDLAVTTSEQEQGLSGRKNLEEDAGMLFIFSEPSENYFWMKDMLFNIDIIWIDDENNIIYIEKNANKESYPTSFGPKQKSKYVLEVLANFAEKNNLKVGEKVEFLP